MRHWLRMRDYWTVKSDALDLRPHTQDSPSLLIKVAATHAGIINGNQRFYRPDRMEQGTHTWMPAQGEFARPILVGHDENQAPVGRVMTARYVDESYKYKGDFSQLRDSLFYATDGKKVDLFSTVDWIVETLMPMEDYRGLGFIELGLKVTNPKAVEMVQRDEYLTVSVGFKTDSAICSLCKTDWAVDDRCDHKMGQVVDGKKMFLISGSMQFEELSFVNFPADPYAGVVSKEKLADALAKSKPFFLGLPIRKQSEVSTLSGLTLTDSMFGSDIQIVEDKMPDTVDPKIAAELESVATPEVTQEEKDAALAEAAEEECPDCNEWAGWQASDEDDKAFFGRTEDEMYADLEADLNEEKLSDAKLSSEQRKKLKGSTFCGPNRSFPVPDCAHVTAARRLIGRAKVSSETKSKILACVSRKASSLGCGGKKDAVEIPQTDSKEGALKALNALDDAYKALEDEPRQAVRSATSALVETWYADGYLAYMKSELAKKDFTVLSKEEKEDTVKVIADLTTSRDAATSKLATSQDTVAKTFLAYKRALASQIVMIKVMRGADGFVDLTPEQKRDKVAEFAKRQVSSLQDTVADILSELKFTDATPATREDKPELEAGHTVTDNTQVAEPAAPQSEKTDDEAGAKKAEELLQARLAAMNPRERKQYLFQLEYDAARAKKTSK